MYDNEEFIKAVESYYEDDFELNEEFIKTFESYNEDDFELDEEYYNNLYYINKDKNELEKHPDNVINIDQNEPKTTNYNTFITPKILIPNDQKEKKMKKKDKIFNIIKQERKKNLGRIKKYLKKTGKHNKFTEDNIIRKIKANFIEKSRNYINHQYDLCMNKHKFKKIKKFLQRISPDEHRKISKEKNIKWFKSKLKDIFSSNLSKKCSLYNPDYNKEQINEVYKNPKAKNVVNILEKSVSELYSSYSKDSKIEGFKTLKDDLEDLKKKMEKEEEENIDEYLKKYEEIAKNLETIYLNKKSRTSKDNN